MKRSCCTFVSLVLLQLGLAEAVTVRSDYLGLPSIWYTDGKVLGSDPEADVLVTHSLSKTQANDTNPTHLISYYDNSGTNFAGEVTLEHSNLNNRTIASISVLGNQSVVWAAEGGLFLTIERKNLTWQLAEDASFPSMPDNVQDVLLLQSDLLVISTLVSGLNETEYEPTYVDEAFAGVGGELRLFKLLSFYDPFTGISQREWTLVSTIYHPLQEASIGFGKGLGYDHTNEVLFVCDMTSSQRGVHALFLDESSSENMTWSYGGTLMASSRMSINPGAESDCRISHSSRKGILAFGSLHFGHLMVYDVSSGTIDELGKANETLSSLVEVAAFDESVTSSLIVLDKDTGDEIYILAGDPKRSLVSVIGGQESLSGQWTWREIFDIGPPDGAAGFGGSLAALSVPGDAMYSFATTSSGGGGRVYVYAPAQGSVTRPPTPSPTETEDPYHQGEDNSDSGEEESTGGRGGESGYDAYASDLAKGAGLLEPTAAPTTLIGYTKEYDFTYPALVGFGFFSFVIITTVCYVLVNAYQQGKLGGRVTYIIDDTESTEKDSSGSVIETVANRMFFKPSRAEISSLSYDRAKATRPFPSNKLRLDGV